MRHQRTKGGDKLCKWQKISTGVPQGLSFIFQHFHQQPFLFIETTTLCNYAYGNTMYSSDNDFVIRMVLAKLHDTRSR